MGNVPIITREKLNIIYKWPILPMFNCLLGNADAWLISRQWIAAEGIPFVPSSVWGSSGTPWSAEDLASIACFWMGKMKLETETNGLCHGFGGTMVPYGAQSNFGGRSKEAHPPKPMPSFASDISARRSSWLTISIYLQNFDMYIFIRINEMCVYIYIYIYVCVCVYPFWIVIFIGRNLYHSFLAILLRSWTSRTGKPWDPCSTRRAISPNFEEQVMAGEKWSASTQMVNWEQADGLVF